MFCDLESLHRYRDQLVDAIRQAFPGVVFNTPFECSVPTTINFSVPGFASKELLDLFDAAGIRVSSGSACGAGKATRSYVLDAMGLPAWRSEAAVRLSFGRAWNDGECGIACARIIESGHALRDACLLSEAASHKNDFDGVLQMKHDGACTWLIIERAAGQCVVIDPIAELGERIERYIRCQDLRVVAVLDTHSHADHESSRAQLLAHLGEGYLSLAQPVDALGWPTQLSNASVLIFGHHQLRRLPLPGHTADSVAYLLSDTQTPARIRQAFIGDTVLSGGIGRSNFANSSSEAMYASLRTLSDAVGMKGLLCPAHDYNNEFATTLEAEVRNNALLADVLSPTPITASEFVAAKELVDATLNDVTGSVVMCGALRCTQDPPAAGIDKTAAGLRDYLHQHPEAILVDVREAYECAMGSRLDPLTEAHTTVVPLSRLADTIPAWLQQPDKPLVFFCRSGNRSALATRCLRKLGHPNAFHLRGGLALFT
jgi:cysteine desulfurase